MAITDPHTVLILGAGASVPFGLPLGGELIDLVRKLVEAEMIYIDYTINPDRPRQELFLLAPSKYEAVALGEHLFVSKSFDGSRHDLNSILGLKAAKASLRQLANRLSGQTSETIDDFIVMNPKLAEITKIAVATVFFLRLYGVPDEGYQTWSLRDLQTRTLVQPGNIDRNRESVLSAPRRNWVHHLINLARNAYLDKEPPNRKIQIISFNYDGIVETVLAAQFANTGELPDGRRFDEWTKYFDITHPHGFMGRLEPSVDDPVGLIRRWAEAICVVREDVEHVPKTISAERVRSRRMVMNAREIYFVGFNLSGANQRLLGLGRLPPERESHDQYWYAANFNGSSGFHRKVMAFHYDGTIYRNVRIRVDIEAGTPSDPLHIDQWFSLEIPGELSA